MYEGLYPWMMDFLSQTSINREFQISGISEMFDRPFSTSMILRFVQVPFPGIRLWVFLRYFRPAFSNNSEGIWNSKKCRPKLSKNMPTSISRVLARANNIVLQRLLVCFASASNGHESYQIQFPKREGGGPAPRPHTHFLVGSQASPLSNDLLVLWVYSREYFKVIRKWRGQHAKNKCGGVSGWVHSPGV